MKTYAWLAYLLVFLPGCAAYKELEPDPPLSANERGYIELKDGKDPFELDGDNKYVIKIPRPAADHFNLVLVTPVKPELRAFLTSSFDEGKGAMVPLRDETASNDSTYVYAVDTKMSTYHWVVEDVMRDLVLALRYRYVPEWRYTFENKYAEFRNVLANNTADRSTYNSIDINFDLARLDFGREIPRVGSTTAQIKSMKEELLHLESIFPPNIAASKDTAYEQYVSLRGKVDDELAFQENYSAILNLFKREKDTRGNEALFIEAIPYFTSIVSRRERFPAGVISKASDILIGRLVRVTPYLDNLLKNKRDANAISPAPTVEDVSALYRACGKQIPPEMESILRFVNRFNTEVAALQSSNRKFEDLKTYFNAEIGSPTETFYSALVSKAVEVRAAIPVPQAARFERYGRYDCSALLSRQIANAANRTIDLESTYQTAETVSKYVGSRLWPSAEASLRELHETGGISDAPEPPAHRRALVKRFENEIFSAVKSASQQRIDAFIKAHEMAVDYVAELYADSAFLPVYQLRFSSAGPVDLAQKRKQIESYLDQIKYVQFPEISIKSIYAEFTRNQRDRGVEKARAIVEHGKFYRGADQQVKGLITECDVEAAKWIVRPKEYRKFFALPVTSNKQGVNEYMFRIRLQIPSEAQFPVFDVTAKLPQEVAEKASREQWFESITIDKKPIKNEGRFRVTSPTSENNYETLITPVQMDKAGRNILEVRFKYPGFRVFEVSAMAQVPIIRKN